MVLVLVRLLSVEAALAHVQIKKDVLVFRCGWGLRILVGSGILFFLDQIVGGLRVEKGWVIGMLVTILMFLAFAWPSTLTIGPDGVSKHQWWRSAVTIPWGKVTAIERNSVGDMQVFGSEGQTVVFTRYHVDPTRFELEIKRRANLDRTMDASAPPTLRL